MFKQDVLNRERNVLFLRSKNNNDRSNNNNDNEKILLTTVDNHKNMITNILMMFFQSLTKINGDFFEFMVQRVHLTVRACSFNDVFVNVEDGNFHY